MLPIAENLSDYFVSSFSGAALLLLAAVPGVLLAVLLKVPAPKKAMVPAAEQR